MKDHPTAKVETTINTDASRVWDALTNPEQIKRYFFGVEAHSDWQVGSPIVYKGEWEGKHFEDKGNVLEVEPGRRLVINYWTRFSGLPDAPENYKKVSYELEAEGDGTKLTITQELVDEDGREASKKNWNTVLDNLKKLLEA
jgi:uncharacterized protein YndB with AHSA1/START domain